MGLRRIRVHSCNRLRAQQDGGTHALGSGVSTNQACLQMMRRQRRCRIDILGQRQLHSYGLGNQLDILFGSPLKDILFAKSGCH